MIRSLLIGLVAGQRAMTPLALVSDAARRDLLPADNGAPRWLEHPLVAGGAALLAAGELAGDKMPSAPDRIVPAGLIGRGLTGAIAGMALSPRRERAPAALLGAGVALASSYIGWRLRMHAMQRHGQVPTGLVEDALVVAGGVATVHAGRKPSLIPRG